MEQEGGQEPAQKSTCRVRVAETVSAVAVRAGSRFEICWDLN